MTRFDSKFFCKYKRENSCDESNDKSNFSPPGIAFTFVMCHPPLSQEADAFQLLAYPGSPQHFIGPELVRGVESKMFEYTRILSLIEIRAAGDNVLRGTAESILLVVVRGTDDILKTVKLPIVIVPGSNKNIFFISAAAQKGAKTVMKRSGSSLDRGPYSVQLTRLDNMEHLDLKIAKQSKN